MANNKQSVIVGPTVFYGKFVEDGTEKMEARPFMVPALRKAQPKFKGQFAANRLRLGNTAAGRKLNSMPSKIRGFHPHLVMAAMAEAKVKALMRCGGLVEAEAKRLTSKGGGKAGIHSAPGEPPRVQSHTLRPSISRAMSEK